MPRPVSWTLIISLLISPLLIHFTFKVIFPFSVYLIALVRRLLIISFTCVLSPINISGISSAIFNSNSIGLSSILVEVILAILDISFLKLYSFSMMSICSLSILFISKILPTISNNVSEAFLISLVSSRTSFGTWSS